MNDLEWLDKAASLSVAEAAGLLAAAAPPAPRQKAADGNLLRDLAIGAGVGAGGMGLAGWAQGKRRKSVLRDMLVGGGLGAAGGAAVNTFLPEIGRARALQESTPEEQAARFAGQTTAKKLVDWAGRTAPDGTTLGGILDPAAHPVAAGAALAGGAYQGQKALVSRALRTPEQAAAGLAEIAKATGRDTNAARAQAAGVLRDRIVRHFGIQEHAGLGTLRQPPFGRGRALEGMMRNPSQKAILRDALARGAAGMKPPVGSSKLRWLPWLLAAGAGAAGY